MKRLAPLLSLATIAMLPAACAQPPAQTASAVPPGAPEESPVPQSYLAIREAPPSPFPSTVPDDPTLGQEDMIGQFARNNGLSRAEAEGLINGSPQFQDEMQRILPLIRQREKANFVDAQMVRDPDVALEVWFKRNAASTLAKYTSNPAFRPREGGLTEGEMKPLRDLWAQRAQESGGIVNSVSDNRRIGIVDVGIGVSEARFKAYAAEKGWTWDDRVRFDFAAAQPDPFAKPEIARQVRNFARESVNPGMRLEALFIGRIWIEDGCFKTMERQDDGSEIVANVLFAYDTWLDHDEEGYLVVRSPGGGVYRIGELGAWGGPNFVGANDPEATKQRQVCGDAPTVNVANPFSNRLFGLPDPGWVSNYAKANGLTRQAAWDKVIACMRREEDAGRKGIDARDRCIRQFN